LGPIYEDQDPIYHDGWCSLDPCEPIDHDDQFGLVPREPTTELGWRVTLGGQPIDYPTLAINQVSIRAHDGNDTAAVDGAITMLFGGPGSDVLTGSLHSDWLYGGPGDDVLYGLAGNDLLVGGLGNNSFYGGLGNDWMFGNWGDDYPDAQIDSEFVISDVGTEQGDWWSEFIHVAEHLDVVPNDSNPEFVALQNDFLKSMSEAGVYPSMSNVDFINFMQNWYTNIAINGLPNASGSPIGGDGLGSYVPPPNDETLYICGQYWQGPDIGCPGRPMATFQSLDPATSGYEGGVAKATIHRHGSFDGDLHVTLELGTSCEFTHPDGRLDEITPCVRMADGADFVPPPLTVTIPAGVNSVEIAAALPVDGEAERPSSSMSGSSRSMSCRTTPAAAFRT
jgi:hypothetical protein